MATQKQIEANRRNARKSTGPSTDLGKAVARFNALKHGLTASTTVLPHEDPSSYTELRDSFSATYRPANAVEASLVEVIANSYWRLLRARRAETAAMNLEIRGLKTRHEKSIAAREDDDNALAVILVTSDSIGKIELHQGKIERAYLQAIETLRKVQKERLREERQTTAPARQPNRDLERQSEPPRELVRTAANGGAHSATSTTKIREFNENQERIGKENQYGADERT